MNKLPKHLGGHAGITHIDKGVIKFIKEKYNINTAYDVGCGVGGMVELMQTMGINCIGIDGDFTVSRKIKCIIHDFSKGMYNNLNNVDFIWSVEFLEHVEEIYLENIFSVFSKSKYILCTAAPPGTEKCHHHVNCQDVAYWIDIFDKHGFDYNKQTTKSIKENSTMKREFMKNTGMFFINRSIL